MCYSKQSVVKHKPNPRLCYWSLPVDPIFAVDWIELGDKSDKLDHGPGLKGELARWTLLIHAGLGYLSPLTTAD